MNRNTAVEINPLLFIWIAIGVLFLPVQWLVAWCVAVAVHELCHYAAIRICGAQTCCVQLGLSGAVMVSEHLTPGKELLCALAGPIGSLLLLAVAKWFPRMAICGFVHAVFNLLPIFPMDGGRILRCVLSLFLSEAHTKKTEAVVSVIIRGMAILIGTYASFFLRLGLLPICVAALLAIKNVKIPCKESCQRVQ